MQLVPAGKCHIFISGRVLQNRVDLKFLVQKEESRQEQECNSQQIDKLVCSSASYSRPYH